MLLQISAWLKGIVNRTVALHTWLDLSQKDTLLKGKLRLNELFRPQTFLNALRQETAQKSGIALDELILDCQWGEGHVLPSAQLSIQVPPPLAHARPCLSTEWALNRRFEEIFGPLFLWSRKEGLGVRSEHWGTCVCHYYWSLSSWAQLYPFEVHAEWEGH